MRLSYPPYSSNLNQHSSVQSKFHSCDLISSAIHSYCRIPCVPLHISITVSPIFGPLFILTHLALSSVLVVNSISSFTVFFSSQHLFFCTIQILLLPPPILGHLFVLGYPLCSPSHFNRVLAHPRSFIGTGPPSVFHFVLGDNSFSSSIISSSFQSIFSVQSKFHSCSLAYLSLLFVLRYPSHSLLHSNRRSAHPRPFIGTGVPSAFHFTVYYLNLFFYHTLAISIYILTYNLDFLPAISVFVHAYKLILLREYE